MNFLSTEYYLEVLFNEYNVSRETLNHLILYIDLLLKWNRKINLIGTNDINEIWRKHILDVMPIIKLLPNKDIDLIDLGSGNGIPGLVLAILGIKNVQLVESNSKKATFLYYATQVLNLQKTTKVTNSRVETESLKCDVLTARAVSNLNNLFNLVKNIKIVDKMLLFKGQFIQEEIEVAKKFWVFNYQILVDKKKQGCILSIKDLKKLD